MENQDQLQLDTTDQKIISQVLGKKTDLPLGMQKIIDEKINVSNHYSVLWSLLLVLIFIGIATVCVFGLEIIEDTTGLSFVAILFIFCSIIAWNDIRKRDKLIRKLYIAYLKKENKTSNNSNAGD